MILVTGTGRSGTSAVARVLHTQLGVDMGGPFDPPHATWPEGNFEDQRYRQAHIDHAAGKLNDGELAHYLRSLSADRAEPWGVKDPRAAELVDVYRQALGREQIQLVICRRDVAAVIASHRRAWPWMSPAGVAETVWRRNEDLRRYWPVATVIDFNRRWTDQELRETLATRLGLDTRGLADGNAEGYV